MVWWSNYESSEFPVGSATNCKYFWSAGVGRNTGNLSPCNIVVFQTGDKLVGPVYSNDSIDITGSPTFGTPNGIPATGGADGGTVKTADPHCLFVNDGTGAVDTTTSPTCASLNGGVKYTVAGSSFGHTIEPLPTDNSQLAATAKQGGCYDQGPTTIALSVTAGGVGQVSVVSKQTANTGGVDTMNLGVDTSTCRTDGTKTNLPDNGVLFVNSSSCSASGTPPPKCVAGANPFDPNTGNSSQIQSNCANCYYGQSGTPDKEGDAFVSDATSSGGLSGQLTVAASNDVIIDGPLTYHDCTWGVGGTGTPSQSVCQYNNAVTGTNDTLGLIANNYVEVNRPVNNQTGSPLARCGTGGALPAPQCDPSTATGSPTGSLGLTIDATVLGLNQSFVVNNYATSGNEGQLTVYGSIQQDARGPVGLVGGTGYVKYYQWDPRTHPVRSAVLSDPGDAVVGPRLLVRELHGELPLPAGGPDLPLQLPADLAGAADSRGQPDERLYRPVAHRADPPRGDLRHRAPDSCAHQLAAMLIPCSPCPLRTEEDADNCHSPPHKRRWKAAEVTGTG